MGVGEGGGGKGERGGVGGQEKTDHKITFLKFPYQQPLSFISSTVWIVISDPPTF